MNALYVCSLMILQEKSEGNFFPVTCLCDNGQHFSFTKTKEKQSSRMDFTVTAAEQSSNTNLEVHFNW